MTEPSSFPDAPGPVVTREGVFFSLYSEHATRVELCLFDSAEAIRESRCLPLTPYPDHLWRVHVRDLRPGCLYGFRVFGPYQPDQGHRFNPAKLLVDPYAKALGRTLCWNDSLFSIPVEGQAPVREPDARDSAAFAPLCKVVEGGFDWRGDRRPEIPWERTIIYEAHVKGLTFRHPGVPEPLRGTFKGLAAPPVIDHLTSLGVTTVELLPVFQKTDEYHLYQNGLTNYWGYNSLLWFAPDPRFATSPNADPAEEFKEMVRDLHSAGLEVILDVVYNHTPEGGALGPTLSFRGIDNAVYYRLDPNAPSEYADFTGCGNSFNTTHPVARRLVLDSLRFWAEEMHVDGFRFDLATVLGRGDHGFDPAHPFFEEIRSDPTLSRLKLIAEPWDLGPGGYQLAHFPPEWSEWNDQYRQTLRRFWKGDAGQIGLFARRFSGSDDIFKPQGRPPRASINYITSHDGFTLQDLVSYNHKHNEANGEHNRDGTDNNESFNYGVEGPTQDPDIRALRLRQKKNMMASLLLSLGTPMLLAGDELGRTQNGNNNAYCQDNETSWVNWELDEDRRGFMEFVRELVHLRKTLPWLNSENFLKGEPLNAELGRDVVWWHPEGREMNQHDWQDPESSCLGILLNGLPSHETGRRHRTLLVLFNAGPDAISFLLPSPPAHRYWRCCLDTGRDGVLRTPSKIAENNSYALEGRSLALLKPEE